MATAKSEPTPPLASLPTVPTADVWHAMTPTQRLDFQVKVLDALSDPAILMSEGRPHKKAQAQAEAAQAQAEAAQAQAEKAQARAVLTVLRARGIAVPDAARERILAQKDAERLEKWLEKAVVAASLDEVLDEPS